MRAPPPEFLPFSQLDRERVNRDLHVHTRWTDGRSTVAEMLRRAEDAGLAEIAFTEHVRADSDWFRRFAGEVREAGAGSRLRVLVGCETRIADEEGNLDLSEETRSLCDVVLASVHRFPGPDGRPVPFSQVPRERFSEIEHRLCRAFLARGGADVLAHPGGMSLRYGDGFPAELYVDLMRDARRAGIAVEINASYMKDFAPFVELLRREDPLVSIGSDAHDVQEVAVCRDRLVGLLWPV